MQECLFVSWTVLQTHRQNWFDEGGNFFSEVSVAITNSEKMSVRGFFEIWVQHKTVLVLLARITRHETDSRRKCVLCDYILHYVLLRWLDWLDCLLDCCCWLFFSYFRFLLIILFELLTLEYFQKLLLLRWLQRLEIANQLLHRRRFASLPKLLVLLFL